MTRLPKVLVTGVQEHQGLAVVRGLGTAGFPVVACASHRHSLGFYSRFAGERERYTPPFESPQRFLDDLVRIIRRTRPALVIPTIESTMVVLSAHREEVERYGAVLAAPSREALDCALDKNKTLRLAARLGIPAPRTAQGDNIEAILAKAADLRFPVAIKPRGNALHGATANALGFKVRYAMDLAELAATLAPFTRDARALLVQEYAAGIGRCVSALCRRGQPLAMFAYEREREYPLSGGVSVLRRTIPLDSRLADWSSALLGSLDWHGVAMVEFKYDRRGDDYTLMEINGRFQASTALSQDAGLNLPALAARMHLGLATGDIPSVRLGVQERWLRGDLLSLQDAFQRRRGEARNGRPPGPRPWKLGVLWRFLIDFRPGTRYDEFRLSDWKPAVIEALSLIGLLGRWAGETLAAPLRPLARRLGRMPVAAAQPPSPIAAVEAERREEPASVR